MIDFTKPVQTRDGRAVELLRTDIKDADYPVVGIVTQAEGVELTHNWDKDGLYIAGVDYQDGDDLVNVPAEHTVYMNFYGGSRYKSRAEANAYATEDRIACVKLTYTEGQFDD